MKESNNGGHPYARVKKQKPQWPTDPTEKKYNNKNYCWYHGYDASNPHTSETCTGNMFGHKKDAKWCNPMGGSQKNKLRVCKKGWKRGRGDDHKHSTLNCNGTIYNEPENTYLCSNIAQAPTTKNTQETKEENSAVSDLGCTRSFTAVSSHLNNVQPKNKYHQCIIS